MRPRNSTLTDHELELMQIVWRRGQATVRDIYEELLNHRKVAYTTVMTTMKTLEQKGFLKISQQNRAFLYRPSQSKHEVVKKMVNDFLDRVFSGSARPLVAHLLEERHVSQSDISEITRLIAEDHREQKATARKKT